MKFIRFVFACLLVTTMAAQANSSSKQTLTLDVNQSTLVSFSNEIGDIFVADPKIAIVHSPSSTHLMVAGKALGSTDVLVLDESGKALGHYVVEVQPDLSKLERAVFHAYPGVDVHFQYHGGSIAAIGVVDSPIQVHEILTMASGFARSLLTEEQQSQMAAAKPPVTRGGDSAVPGGGIGKYPYAINQLTTSASNQVNISVRIVEMERSTSEQLGLRWSSIGNLRWGKWDTLQTAMGLAPGNRFPKDTLPSGNSQHGLNAVIDALVENSLVNVLAEPNLTAKSGEAATFVSGGEFPFPIATGEGEISIEFKKFGISLELTPTVLSDNNISLTVSPEVSTLSREYSVSVQGVEVPGIETRRATTTIELADGQSFALAGLVRTYQDHKIEALPILGEIPLLAPLFSTNSFKNTESELVIIATAHIVEPVNDLSQLSTPLDHYRPATRLERLLFQDMGSSENSHTRLFGHYGYQY